MKKKSRKTLACLLVLLVFAPVVQASEAGKLVLDPKVITGQASNQNSTSSFEIRGQLFSDELTKQSQSLDKAANSYLKAEKEIPFQKYQIKLYDADYKNLQGSLFSNYQEVHLANQKDAQVKRQSSLWALLLLIPLFFMTIALAKYFARRKRRKELF